MPLQPEQFSFITRCKRFILYRGFILPFLFGVILLPIGFLPAKAQSPAAPATGTPPAGSVPAPESVQRIRLEKRFNVFAGQRLELGLETSVRVTLTGWDREQVEVRADMEGRSFALEVMQESGVVLVKSRFSKEYDGAFSRGEIQIRLPYGTAVRGKVAQGDVTLSDVRGEIVLETGQGQVRGYQLQGGLQLTAGGGVELSGGRISGNITARLGEVRISGVGGGFTAAGGAGQFTVDSPDAPVEASISATQLTLSVSKGDLEARAFRSRMDIIWKGDPLVRGRKLSLSGQESRITLSVPEALGMDAFLEQISSEKKPAPAARPPKDARSPVESAMESEFDLGTMPQAKNFTHQGRKLRLVQADRKINRGGNKLEIRATDSQVKLRKLARG